MTSALRENSPVVRDWIMRIDSHPIYYMIAFQIFENSYISHTVYFFLQAKSTQHLQLFLVSFFFQIFCHLNCPPLPSLCKPSNRLPRNSNQDFQKQNILKLHIKKLHKVRHNYTEVYISESTLEQIHKGLCY